MISENADDRNQAVHKMANEVAQSYITQLNKNSQHNEAIEEADRPKSMLDIIKDKGVTASETKDYSEFTQKEFDLYEITKNGHELRMFDWLKVKIDNWRFTNLKFPFGREVYLHKKGVHGSKANFDLYQEMEKDGLLNEVLDTSDYNPNIETPDF